MKIRSVAILGAGAVGAYFVWGLSKRTDIEVFLVAEGRRKERLEQNGIIINKERYDVKVKTPSQAKGVDLLLIAVKYNALPKILDDIEMISGENTLVMSLLNGVDSEDIIAGRIGSERIMYSLMRISAERRENKIYFNPKVTAGVFFGAVKERDYTAIEALKELFEGYINYHVCDDIMHELWLKYAGNVSNNLPQAIFSVGVGAYVDSEHAAYIAETMWNEVAEVAATRNIGLGKFDAAAWAGRKSSRFSTLQDIDAKRHTEIDAFAGALMKMAAAEGIRVPFTEFAYHAIKTLEEKNDGKFEYETLCID